MEVAFRGSAPIREGSVRIVRPPRPTRECLNSEVAHSRVGDLAGSRAAVDGSGEAEGDPDVLLRDTPDGSLRVPNKALMKLIKEQWGAAVAIVWSISAVLSLIKGELLFADIAVERRCRHFVQ